MSDLASAFDAYSLLPPLLSPVSPSAESDSNLKRGLGAAAGGEDDIVDVEHEGKD